MAKIGGLIESRPEDIARRYRFGSIHVPINLADLAGIDFTICNGDEIKDQGGDDDCTGCSVTDAVEAHVGFPCEEKWQFMKTKLKEGDKDTFGASLEDALSIPCDIGALPKKDTPQDMQNAPRDTYADWTKWLNLDSLALPQKQGSFFWITQDSYPSLFDALRAALWQYKDKKNKIVTGTNWHSSWSGSSMIPKEIPNDVSTGHSFTFEGQKYINGECYLIAHLSNGKDFGDNGHFYFPEEVINKLFTYGSAMFIPLPQNAAERAANSNLNPSFNWKLAWIHATLLKISAILSLLTFHAGD